MQIIYKKIYSDFIQTIKLGGIFMAATIIVIAIVVIIIGYGISIYNSIAKSEIKVDEGYSTIDVYLKKRYDLIFW